VTSSGVLLVTSGAAASGAVVTSSGVDVIDGGTASGTIVTGGGIEVLVSGGTASGSIVVSSGIEVVANGGAAHGLIIGSGGIDVVVSGGTQSGTIVSGTDVVVSGIATSTTVASGGVEIVESGSVDNAVTISGGLFDILSGASTGSGPVTFAGGGLLVLDTSQSFHGLVAGFGAGDQLDLKDIAFGSGTHVSFTEATGGTSGTLTVTDGTHTANIELLGQYAASQFTSTSDGTGTIIGEQPPAATAALATPHH
jgi:autotransporter passenger strand-loop-strand repeat protein